MTPAESSPDVFQAIADPTRRRILAVVADKEMSIAAIAECFPLSRTAINKHLHILAESGLVTKNKVGRETRYKLRPDPLFELDQWLSFFEKYWSHKLSALAEYVESDDAE